MAKTKTRKHKNMKGCSKKNCNNNCSKCKRKNTRSRRSQSGGNSVGIFQNISTIGSNFLNSFTNVYNGLYTIPQNQPMRF